MAAKNSKKKTLEINEEVNSGTKKEQSIQLESSKEENIEKNKTDLDSSDSMEELFENDNSNSVEIIDNKSKQAGEIISHLFDELKETNFDFKKIVVLCDSYLKLRLPQNKIMYSRLNSLLDNANESEKETIVNYSHYCVVQSLNQKNEDLQHFILKIDDHINLVITQESYVENSIKKAVESFKTTVSELETQRNNLQQQADELKKQAEESKKMAEDTEQKMNDLTEQVKQAEECIKNSDKNHVTILGIFAAIVLAFVGSVTFSTSVLENIDKSSIYRLLGVILGLGIILTNIIYMLTRFIFKINDNKFNDEEQKKKIKFHSYDIVYACFDIFYLICAILLFISWNNKSLGDGFPKTTDTTQDTNPANTSPETSTAQANKIAKNGEYFTIFF